MWSHRSFPPWEHHAIWREKSFESVECIYILEEPCAYFMANFYESSCKNIWVRPELQKFFKFKLVKEVRG